MALSLRDLKTATAVLPPRILIVGPHGMGKTTLAAEFPDPVFIQIENGTTNDMKLQTFGLLTSFEQVMEAIRALYTEKHAHQTVALDALDKLEPLVWAATCARMKWDSIESPGYGKGYLAADVEWRELLEGLNALRRDLGMAIVLIAHSEIERFDDPTSVSYSRYDIRLHKRARALVQDEMDAIFFVSQKPAIKEEEVGFNKKRAHAEGTQTWIFTRPSPSMNAKNRYGMPSPLLFKKGKGFDALAKYFPGGEGAPIAPEAEGEATTQETATEQKTAA